MGRLKQPKSLELLSIEKSAEWLCNIGEKLISECKMSLSDDDEDVPHAHKFTHEDLDLVVKTSHDLFERYVPYYLYQTLSDEVTKRITELIEKCKNAIEFKINMARFTTQIKIAVRLSEALISIKLRSIDFEELPKMIRSSFYSQLTRLEGIEHLKLGSVTGGWKTFEMESQLASSIKPMKNLTQLCLNYDCTDKILKVLVKNCPKLLSLDITNSKYVTNKSVDIIMELKSLKIIQLYRTGVSMEGYINLLLHLPELLDVGRYDELGKCLEFIDEYHPTYGNFKLEHFSSNHATTSQVQILCEKFPNLNSISLFHDEIRLDLMTLIGINKLEKLKLRSCEFFTDHIRDLIEVKGCNITTLVLEHVDQIDMNALIYISQSCPELQTLFICNCNLLPSTSHQYRYCKLPPFVSLKSLTLIGTCGLEHLEYILSYSYKIKFIHLGSHIPTTDELFEKVFLKNELFYLEELRIMQSYALTIKAAFMLVNNCANLQRLNELESWYCVYPLQIDELKDYVRRHNLDVDLTSYRKFVT
jgi:hypothetical protein